MLLRVLKGQADPSLLDTYGVVPEEQAFMRFDAAVYAPRSAFDATANGRTKRACGNPDRRR